MRCFVLLDDSVRVAALNQPAGGAVMGYYLTSWHDWAGFAGHCSE
jgi:hypothetical protein